MKSIEVVKLFNTMSIITPHPYYKQKKKRGSCNLILLQKHFFNNIFYSYRNYAFQRETDLTNKASAAYNW